MSESPPRSDVLEPPDERAAAVLAHAASLEARDLEVGEALAEIDDLAARVAALRAGGAAVRERETALPVEFESAERGAGMAQEELVDARAEQHAAEQRVLSLSRRASEQERDQVARELTRANERFSDAVVDLERAESSIAMLNEERATLVVQAQSIVGDAEALAQALTSNARITQAAKQAPGADLTQVEEWGAQARAALVLVRATLANERERLILEAEALGSAVLGETFAGSNVALVRRRIEQALGA